MRPVETRFLLPLLVIVGFLVAQDIRAQEKKSQPPSVYEAIDRHALDTPAEAERTIRSLAEYLAKPAKTDREKSRAIFRWMTDRVAYDAEAYLAGKPVGNVTAEGVMVSRKTVCAGYANLFEKLAKMSGLEVIKIVGTAKGYGYVPGKTTEKHEWNAVKLDKEWWLMDCTWGAGHIKKEKGFVKQLNESYFLSPPEQIIFSHFPDVPAKQFLKPPIDAKTFRSWPKIPTALFAMGVQPKDIKETLGTKDFPELVTAFEIHGNAIRVQQAPLKKHLVAGAPVEFQIEAKSALGVAVINAGKFQFLTAMDGVYRATVMPMKGELKVSAKVPDKGPSYWTFLQYAVE